jgi:DHA2 family multidrug resistance protein
MVGEAETGPLPIEAPAPAGWQRSIASVGLILAAGLQAVDVLIANVALPQLQQDLGGGISLGAWVIASYLCAAAVMAPLTGWLRRRYGARRLFLGAVGVFSIASLLCAIAPSAGTLIFFRLLQGAGGGVIHPLAQAILLDIYPSERHGRIMAILGAGLMVGPILGPPLGGFITDIASWRWVFLINLPLGLLSIGCVWRLRTTVETARDPTIDVVGILLLIAGVAASQLFLQRGIEQSWFRSPEIIAEAAIAVAAFALLAVRARGTGFTAFRLATFKDVNFVAAAFYNFMLSALLFVTLVFVPSLAQGPLGFPATTAGAIIVPRAILLMAVMLFVGRLIGKVDHRILLGGGWGLMSAGLFILSGLQPDHALTWIVIGSTIQAIGAGMLYIPLVTLAFSTLATEIRTDAAGLYSLLRQIAYASGVALASALLQSKIATNLADLPPGIIAGPGQSQLVADATLSAYVECFWLMAITAAAIIPGIWLFRAGPGRSGTSPLLPAA